MKNNEVATAELLVELKKTVGGHAYRALIYGRPLKLWRGSSPHNWFIERSNEDGYLWHSEEGNARKIPNLQLFRVKMNSKERVVDYLRLDYRNKTNVGLPFLTEYVLKSDVAEFARFLYE